MKAFGYDFNPGHAMFGGYGWILSTDEWFVFIPFPILEVEAVVVFVLTFSVASQIVVGAP